MSQYHPFKNFLQKIFTPGKEPKIERIEYLLCCVKQQLIAAQKKHNPIKSPHEGYSIILEELDELWEKVKTDDLVGAGKEAVHVAAMSLRFVYDLYETTERSQK